MKYVISLLLIFQLISCDKGKTKLLEIGNEEFSIIKHLTEEVSYEKRYDKDALLVQEKWYYKTEKKPFLILTPKTREQFYDKSLFDETILDTPKIVQTKLYDSIYELKIIPKNYPIRLMSHIGWSYVSDVQLQKETKFNSYILIINSNSVIKDSIPFLTFKFYDPITDRLIKSIDKVPLDFSKNN